MNLEDLERRLRVLEDIEAIKKLKARYCAYCDNNYDADGIAALFTEDAVWDGGNFGRYEGREAIRTFFRGAPRIFPFAIHQVMNPIIEVEGEQAKGQLLPWGRRDWPAGGLPSSNPLAWPGDVGNVATRRVRGSPPAGT